MLCMTCKKYLPAEYKAIGQVGNKDGTLASSYEFHYCTIECIPYNQRMHVGLPCTEPALLMKYIVKQAAVLNRMRSQKLYHSCKGIAKGKTSFCKECFRVQLLDEHGSNIVVREEVSEFVRPELITNMPTAPVTYQMVTCCECLEWRRLCCGTRVLGACKDCCGNHESDIIKAVEEMQKQADAAYMEFRALPEVKTFFDTPEEMAARHGAYQPSDHNPLREKPIPGCHCDICNQIRINIENNTL